MKMKIYKKILLIELSILATLILHYFVTDARGYKAIGGEFLLIPLLYVIHKGVQAFSARVKETNDHFRRKEETSKWEERRKFSC